MIDTHPRSRPAGSSGCAARGQRLGRPPALNAEQIAHARHMLTAPNATITSIAKLLGVTRATIYKHIPELQGPGWGGKSIPTQDAKVIEGITVTEASNR